MNYTPLFVGLILLGLMGLFADYTIDKQRAIDAGQVEKVPEVHSTNIAIKILIEEEGFSAEPYRDAGGYVAVGYGKVIGKDGLLHQMSDFDKYATTKEEALVTLQEDVAELHGRILNGKHGKVFSGLNKTRQAIIISMGYQMGYGGLLGFHNMWKALYNKDYVMAAAEMVDSNWCTQTNARCNRHATMMQHG